MSGHLPGQPVGDRTARSAPQVLRVGRAVGQPELVERHADVPGAGRAVEHGHGAVAVGERPDQDLERGVGGDHGALTAHRVLVQLDHPGVAEGGEPFGGQLRDLGGQDEGGRHHGPEGDLAAAFGRREPGGAGDQEVGVVPVAGARVPAEPAVVAVVAQDRAPPRGGGRGRVVDLDVLALAPQLAGLADPAEDLVPVGAAPLALLEVGGRGGRQDHVAAALPHGLRDGVVGVPVGLLLGLALRHPEVAAVHLDVVDVPGRELPGVLRVVVRAAALGGAAAGVLLAGEGAGVLVDAELQPLGVQMVAEPGHAVRELRLVDDQTAVRVPALGHPAVVDGHRVVALGGEPGRHERVGVGDDFGLVDVAHVVRPVVPAHGRGERERGVRGRPGLGRHRGGGEREGEQGGRGQAGERCTQTRRHGVSLTWGQSCAQCSDAITHCQQKSPIVGQ